MTQKTALDGLQGRARALGLNGIAEHCPELDTAEIALLLRLLDWEEAERARRSLERRLSEAHLGVFKPMADFDWTWPKRCDREAVEELLRLSLLADGGNAVLVGPNGVGKSTIAQNVGHQAVLAGHTVRFTTASEMLNDLAAKDSATVLARRIKLYVQPRLLVIDELGYLSYGLRHADLLFEVTSRRCAAGKSTLVTTNKAFADWGEVFPNATCVVTLVDRLIHRCDIIEIQAESYRLKEARERTARRTKDRQARKARPPASTPTEAP